MTSGDHSADEDKERQRVNVTHYEGVNIKVRALQEKSLCSRASLLKTFLPLVNMEVQWPEPWGSCTHFCSQKRRFNKSST